MTEATKSQISAARVQVALAKRRGVVAEPWIAELASRSLDQQGTPTIIDSSTTKGDTK